MPPQTNRQTPRKKARRGRLAALLLLLLAVVGWLTVAGRQALYDWLRLRGYSPPSAIAALAADDQFTASARRVFYVNHPAIEGKAAFAHSCPNGGKEAAVLGCYVPPQQGIYILQVSDPALDGIEQVTAAHELLHAEYDRLDSATRTKVDGWLEAYYKHGLTDPIIIKQMATYQKTEPNAMVDEMHSVFGTEVANLPTDLQQYYQRYFTNRGLITADYSRYENQFSQRLAAISHDDTQLAAWKTQINSLEADAQSRQTAISNQLQQLSAYRQSGDISAYNGGVGAFNAAVDSYNAEVAQIHALVQQYNQLVTERNAIALEEQQLVQDISSQAAPLGQRP